MKCGKICLPTKPTNISSNMDDMKYSLFNEVLQEAMKDFWKQKRQIIRMLQKSGIIVRHRKIKSAAVLYHAAYAKAVRVSSYEELAQYMAREHNVQMYPSAWKKWLDKVAPKLLEFAERQILKAMGAVPDRKEFAIDATRFAMDGTGEIARVHTLMQLGTGLPIQTEVTDQHGAESAARIQVDKDALYIGDRAYGRSADIAHIAQNQGNYIFRISPNHIRLYSDEECRNKIKISDYLTGDRIEMICWCSWKKKTYKLRLLGKLLPTEKQGEAEARARRAAGRKGYQIQPHTVLYAKWILLVTSLIDRPAEEILKKYKERWQIELFFKRGKSALKFRKLPYSTERYRVTEITLWLFVVKLCSVAVFRFLQTHTGDFSLYMLFSLAKCCFA